MKKILAVSLFRTSGREKPYFYEHLGERGLSYFAYGLGTERTIPIFIKGLFVPRRLSRYDLIITSEYFSSFAINLRLALTLSRTKHMTIGLNQSRTLLRSRFSVVNKLVSRIFNRTDLIVVHSRKEIDLFARAHGIALDKFYFSLWGFDLPKIGDGTFSSRPKPYVCLVGRNNRDIETFIDALTDLPIDGIIITSSFARIQRSMPNNVFVYRDLPLNETLSCIKGAKANLILLRDGGRGAGHITAVAAMFAGVPQIVSKADIIKDYVVDGRTAIVVPLGDATAVREAVMLLLQNPSLGSQLSERAQQYALQWMTNDTVSKRIVDAISKLIVGDPHDAYDRDWFAAYESLESERLPRSLWPHAFLPDQLMTQQAKSNRGTSAK